MFALSLGDVFEDWQGPILSTGERMIYRPSLGFVPDTLERSPVNGQRDMTMNDLRRDLFALIDRTPHLDWLLLTKRPENVRRMWPGVVGAHDDPGRRRPWGFWHAGEWIHWRKYVEDKGGPADRMKSCAE